MQTYMKVFFLIVKHDKVFVKMLKLKLIKIKVN